MTQRDVLCKDLDELYQVQQYNDYCPNGLQVEGRESILRLCTAVTASLSTIREAVRWGADALLVHHGLFWKGDDFTIRGVKRQKLSLLFEHGISLLAYHLPMDAHTQWGNNWGAARELGWKECEPFGLMGGSFLGVRGRFEERSIESFIHVLEEYYDHPAHVALGGAPRVSQAALISGGAHKEVAQALAAGVDCFITGSYDEPLWHIAHEEGIHFIALGHAATERIGPRLIGGYLSEKWGIETQFLDCKNPF